jgi:F-type H+-transporting ATPase subunit b
MGIDLVTLIAQIINLVVLIWLMKRFLYQPILKMVSERQAFIDAEIKRAHQARQEALLQEAQYSKRVADFDAKRSEMMAEARKEVENFKQKLLAESKQAISYSRKNWQVELEQEKQSFDAGLQASIVKNFKLFASDALKDMAGVELTSLVLEKFKEKMQKMSKSAHKQMSENILKNGKIVISTDSKLDTNTKSELKAFLTDLFDLQTSVKFDFKEDENLICGIQIQVGEHQTSWNLKNYLEAFEDNMDAAFNELLHQGA